MKLGEIAALIGAAVGETEGEIEIRRVAKIEEAAAGDITFLANPKYLKYLSSTAASAVILGRHVDVPARQTTIALLRVDDPYGAFLRALVALEPSPDPVPPGIHPTAVIDPTAALGHEVRVGAHAVVGPGCQLGDHVMLGHGVVLGEGVTIGPESLLHHRVTVRERCRIGARVIVQSGAVIGSDGFGFAPRADGTYEKIPQTGIVVIEDDVEIGANTTIDRATIGETVIGRGAKLDNLIQIAHNVVVGDHTVIAAQTGVSGSTRLGRNCIIAGQVGFVGHIEIADRTTIAAQSGVHKSVAKPGETLFGYPAHPHRQSLRMQGALTQLPDLLATVRELQQKVATLEDALSRLTG